MKLSILIATQGRRNPKFRKLVEKLMHQARKYEGDIEVIAYWNNGELPIGVIRRKLLEEATGDYVCFIDDDDDIPDYYCEEIIWHLGEDYVGFGIKAFTDGVEQLPVIHSLEHMTWTEDDKGYYRGVTHLNPILRKIALKGTFTVNGAGEDYDWSRSVREWVHTQRFIDKVMYFYHHNKDDTSFGGNFVYRLSGYRRPKIAYKGFRYHPDSKEVSKEVENNEDN